MRGAYLHVLADLLGSVAVIIAALVISVTDWHWVDPVASLVIALLILPRSWQLLRTAGAVLMERVPDAVDPTDLQEELVGLHGVERIHDLHVWSVDGESALASVHVVADGASQQHPQDAAQCAVLDRVQEIFRGHGIDHATVQVEVPGHENHEDSVCG
jgi:cobalt-zinc-cadmium efflux system protein